MPFRFFLPLPLSVVWLLPVLLWPPAHAQAADPMPSFESHIRTQLASKREIDVFLNEPSWAQFDSELGYVLSNFMPRDGIAGSSTISTVQSNGMRTSFAYRDKPCRINTYGNSFTQCHQVSDAETWQEYLAGHLGEPIRNYGMGGFGLYQSYRRMIREEQTAQAADHVLLYIWGDDHIRSLLRCRYMLITRWNKKQDTKEGRGRMFHGNFWSNIEMDLDSGKLVEHPSRIQKATELHRMTDADWIWESLQDDLALQMALYAQGMITDVDTKKLEQLATHLGVSMTFAAGAPDRKQVAALLDAYAFAATKEILLKAKAFAAANDKKLMILLLDPYRVTRALLQGGERYDQEIVDFLAERNFTVFDMNLVHLQDYKQFKPDVNAYFNRYFIGHYNPTGNHFFAYSLRAPLVAWLDGKPTPYTNSNQRQIDFKGYLPGEK